MLACGPYFDETGLVASLVIFVAIKPLAYYAFILAYRYRVSRAIPMTRRQAVKLAALRALIGLVLVGGGAWALALLSNGGALLASWIYLYLARLVAWWVVGKLGAGLRGKRFVGWIVGGIVLNAAFDVAVVAGLLAGWVYPTGIVMLIVVFIAVLDRLGRRTSLQARFSDDPLCTVCQYNLTGNLSGICPECGTPVAVGGSWTE